MNVKTWYWIGILATVFGLGVHWFIIHYSLPMCTARLLLWSLSSIYLGRHPFLKIVIPEFLHNLCGMHAKTISINGCHAKSRCWFSEIESWEWSLNFAAMIWSSPDRMNDESANKLLIRFSARIRDYPPTFQNFTIIENLTFSSQSSHEYRFINFQLFGGVRDSIAVPNISNASKIITFHYL